MPNPKSHQSTREIELSPMGEHPKPVEEEHRSSSEENLNPALQVFKVLSGEFDKKKDQTTQSEAEQKRRFSPSQTVTAKSDGVDLGLKIATGSFLVAAGALAVIGLFMTIVFPPAVLPILATAAACLALAAITGLIKGVRSFIRDKIAKSEAARNEAGGVGQHDTHHGDVKKVVAEPPSQALGSGPTAAHHQAVQPRQGLEDQGTGRSPTHR